MPKKPIRDNRERRELRTVHTAGDRAASLLQRIARQAKVVLPASGRPGPEGPDWLARLQAALPPELRPHLTQVLEKPEGLVLFVSSAAWASRMKLVLPELAGVAERRQLLVRLDPGQKRRATR